MELRIKATFIPVMHQPCIKGVEEYMYESDRMYAKEKRQERCETPQQI